MNWPHTSISQVWRIRILASITIAVTAVISFSSLRNLADRAGWGDLSWLFPVCLDAVAALAVELWLSNSPARRGARLLALSAIVLSTVGNVFDWGIRSNLWPVPVWLAPALGAVPPVGLGFLLLVLHVHTRSTPSPSLARHEPGTTVTKPLRTFRGPEDHSAPIAHEGASATGMDLIADLKLDLSTDVSPAVDNSVPPAQRKIRTASRSSAKRTDEELVALIRDHEQKHGPMSRRLIMRTHRVGSEKASELQATARNGQVR